MPIHVYWHNDAHRIIRIDLEGMWTLQEIYRVIDTTYEMMKSYTHPIDLLVDFSKSSSVAAKIIPMLNPSMFQYVETLYLPNRHSVVMVNATLIVRALFKIASSVAPQTVQNMHYVETINEALELIEKNYPAT